MIKIEDVEVMGMRKAIKGMRNAMNSWDKSDSYIDEHEADMFENCANCRCGIDPPTFIELTITECEPAVAGNTSGTAYKPAKCETGLVVKVPLFVNNGEKIRIDTRTGEYMERVK